MYAFIDLDKSLEKAWTNACASRIASKVLVPKNRYSLRQIELNGPCKAPIELNIEGYIQAPDNPNQFKTDAEWIRFGYIDSLTLTGNAVFDGRGSYVAWTQNNCDKTWNCRKLPMVSNDNLLHISKFIDMLNYIPCIIFFTNLYLINDIYLNMINPKNG